MKPPRKISRSLWVSSGNPRRICIIDQRYLPHRQVIAQLRDCADAYEAIREMKVRGAPLIGVTAAYGMYLAALQIPVRSGFDRHLKQCAERLKSARPTAVNLSWAVEKVLGAVARAIGPAEKIRIAFRAAWEIERDDVETCRKIGEHGVKVIETVSRRKKGLPVHILTHCNAGWLACVEWGTATSPIYQAFNKGIPVHVWVDETRPRNQGAALTAWELGLRGVPHTIITDNAGGHLMQKGKVDLVIVGTDRTAANGDVANKIGTYLKALAARAHGVPFYAAVPSSSIDWSIESGQEIPIEERSPDEVKYVQGLCGKKIKKVLVAPESSSVANYGFDVTPHEFVTGLITERGIAKASRAGLLELFPERKISVGR